MLDLHDHLLDPGYGPVAYERTVDRDSNHWETMGSTNLPVPFEVALAIQRRGSLTAINHGHRPTTRGVRMSVAESLAADQAAHWVDPRPAPAKNFAGRRHENAVLWALDETGGFEDKGGGATSLLAAYLIERGYRTKRNGVEYGLAANVVSMVTKELDAIGALSRSINGKRCYAIRTNLSRSDLVRNYGPSRLAARKVDAPITLAEHAARWAATPPSERPLPPAGTTITFQGVSAEEIEALRQPLHIVGEPDHIERVRALAAGANANVTPLFPVEVPDAVVEEPQSALDENVDDPLLLLMEASTLITRAMAAGLRMASAPADKSDRDSRVAALLDDNTTLRNHNVKLKEQVVEAGDLARARADEIRGLRAAKQAVEANFEALKQAAMGGPVPDGKGFRAVQRFMEQVPSAKR